MNFAETQSRDSTPPPPSLSLRMSISRVYPAIAPAEKVPCVGMGMMGGPRMEVATARCPPSACFPRLLQLAGAPVGTWKTVQMEKVSRQRGPADQTGTSLATMGNRKRGHWVPPETPLEPVFGPRGRNHKPYALAQGPCLHASNSKSAETALRTRNSICSHSSSETAGLGL